MDILLLGEAFSLGTFCTKTGSILKVVGIIITIIKIFIPFLIIIFGMLDFGKAVVAAKDDEIKASAKSLGRRAVAGLIIFFIPTLVMWIFEALAPKYEDDTSEFTNCKNCILHPFGGNCQETSLE